MVVLAVVINRFIITIHNDILGNIHILSRRLSLVPSFSYSRSQSYCLYHCYYINISISTIVITSTIRIARILRIISMTSILVMVRTFLSFILR